MSNCRCISFAFSIRQFHMEHINKICKEQEYPIEVENSPTLGNHAVAARDIPRGEGLLRVQ